MGSARLVLVLAVLTVSACSSERATGFLPVVPTPGAEKSVTLSYRGADRGEATFTDYRKVVRRAARSYVRVRILAAADEATPRDEGAPTDVINFASGFIADDEGHVVTAAHIALSPENRAEVIVMDGRTFPARILAVDPKREMAVLKIEPFDDMEPADFADSDDIEAGAPAFAIGTPDNKPGVVSLGTVKTPRLDETIAYDPYSIRNAIELSIDVEPGHSGGPLFDREGELIGMIAAFEMGESTKSDADYVSPMIGFAVPSNDIETFVEDVADR